MFQFPALALPCLYIQQGVTPCYRCCVSTFRNLRINACLPASRSLSQAAASFFASRCQDIHRAPLVSLTSWIEDRSGASCDTQIKPFTNRSTSPTGARAMPAQTERPKKRSFKSRHRRSHLLLSRTSYLIVKEHVFACFCKHASTTRQARVSLSSPSQKTADLLMLERPQSYLSCWGFCHRLNRRFHFQLRWGASQFDEICNKLAVLVLIRWPRFLLTSPWMT